MSSPVIVLGEAPESDDEDYAVFTAVHGEILKSNNQNLDDGSGNLEIPSASSAVSENNEKPVSVIRFASHKKLREYNKRLHSNLTQTKKFLLNTTNRELNNMNQQLLRSQVELQQTLSDVRNFRSNLKTIDEKLNSIIASNYIPNINIRIPASII